jgi:hypothetical protein
LLQLLFTSGAHAILYSDGADATRATLATSLGTRSVDAGDGSLISAPRPAELAVHPATQGGRDDHQRGSIWKRATPSLAPC